MISRLVRFVLKIALVAGAGAVVSKVLERRRTEPFPPVPNAPWPPIDLADRPTDPPADASTNSPAPPPADLPAGGIDPGALAHDAEGEALDVEADVEAEEAPGTWVEPDDTGECPASHPVKAKVGSGVFHLEGMANYERTKADRCYPDEAAAEADGLRQAKR